MRDAKDHLGALDLLEAPDVWEEALTRRPSPEGETSETVRRGPQRVLAAVVAIGIFAGAALFAVRAFNAAEDRVHSSPTVSAPGDTHGVWQPVPAPPIPFREGAAGFWVDGRVVIVGGSDEAPSCPRLANCAGGGQPPLLDGAAYEPSTGTWTKIAPSPMPVLPYAGAVVGDVVYIWGSTDGFTEETLLAFDVNDDQWREFPLPPGPHRPTGLMLTTASDLVLAYADSQERGVTPDALFDPSTGEWSPLPLDPLVPSFDRSIVWTGNELVLIAPEVEPPQVASYVRRVATYDIARGTWRRLPNSPSMGDPIWFWSGGRVVNPEIGHVGDNGSVAGTGPPYGGIFDPSTSAWSELPPPPERLAPYGGPSVGGSRYVVTEQGAILDVEAGAWEALPATPTQADEQAVAVWAGDRLIVWGGYRWNRTETAAEMVDAGWLWIPSG
ncbi:MAG: hypothetical protein WD096_10510 [Actinomycetota bacterium]